jgi:hypothetical protein
MFRTQENRIDGDLQERQEPISTGGFSEFFRIGLGSILAIPACKRFIINIPAPLPDQLGLAWTLMTEVSGRLMGLFRLD